MATKLEVQTVLDGERDHQDEKYGVGERGSLARTIAEFTLYIKYYANEAAVLLTINRLDQGALDFIRKTGALCVATLEAHGAPVRVRSGVRSLSLESADRVDVYTAFDSERNHQFHIRPPNDPNGPATPSLGAFVLYINQFANMAGDAATLDIPREPLELIRKIGDLCVACMEAHGAPAREVPPR